MSWRDYEHEVATFFTSLGWTVEVQADIQGVRTRHKIDVWAQSNPLGLHIRLAIECKEWNTRVSQEKVLALRTIVHDVGADRGILMSESGFQSGAHDAARNTNVLLTSLAELSTVAAQTVLDLQLRRAHVDLADQCARTHSLTVSTRAPGITTSRPRRGMTDSRTLIERIGFVSTAEQAVARARANQVPVVVPNRTLDGFLSTADLNVVLLAATTVAEWHRPWLEAQEAAITDAGGWAEPAVVDECGPSQT